jgi:hypothetical protein
MVYWKHSTSHYWVSESLGLDYDCAYQNIVNHKKIDLDFGVSFVNQHGLFDAQCQRFSCPFF